ncbi:MAG TPA: MMPL family transporter [Streptosporangiaceae bacterium]|nr:MMPL family transporter [Streptosporangiaceae bacterium]
MSQSQIPVLPHAGRGSHEPGRPARPPLVERIAGWSAAHRKTAVFGWLLLVAVVVLAGQAAGTKSVPVYDAGQSGQAEQALHRLGVTAPAVEDVLIQARAPGRTFASDPAMRQAARQVAAALARLPGAAAGIRSPLEPGNAGLVSAGGRSALVTFQVPGPAASQATAVAPALRAIAAAAASYPGLRIAEGGDASYAGAINSVLASGFRRAEATSVPVTLVLLVAVFGALIAAGIPLLLAITSVLTALSLLTLISHFEPVGSSTSEVVLVIGMAVGVDYSLFYLRREREERAAGRGPREALRIAAATSGRAIVVSGLTVMIALAGLFLTGYDVFSGIAFGTIAVVGTAVLGSLTVLPALLSWLGPRADRGRIPFLGRRRTAARPSRAWGALARRVVRRPAVWGGVATVALLALAAPALGLRIGEPAIDLPAGNPVLRTIDSVQRAFPQSPSPAQVVVTGTGLASPAMRDALAALRDRAGRGGPGLTATPVAGGRGLIIGVPLAGNGGDAASTAALLTLRDRVLPATLGRVGGISYAVAGDTASTYDDDAALHAATPLVIAFVAGLAFVLLLVAFRSVTIPLVSIALNLLSVAAGYGLITLIFQDGRLQGLLGYTSFGAIIAWIPLFMFVMLFGLSMDYHVFILSRVRELRARGASTRDALVGGIAGSAGVVTSAAVIMVAVFSILATLPIVDSKTLGVGLAAAVLIDATVVRGILLPAAMALLGERCWWLPRWLAWLPGRKA